MKKEIVYQIQRKVVKLLRSISNKPLCISSIGNCSEVARLVGCWLFEKLPKAEIYILKGKGVRNTNQCHDILAVKCDDSIDLIDPTVWQFFKSKKSIFIKSTNTISNCLSEANKFYVGKWKISEVLHDGDYSKNELKKIIALNNIE